MRLFVAAFSVRGRARGGNLAPASNQLRWGRKIHRRSGRILRWGRKILRRGRKILRRGRKILRRGRKILRWARKSCGEAGNILLWGRKILRQGRKILRWGRIIPRRTRSDVRVPGIFLRCRRIVRVDRMSRRGAGKDIPAERGKMLRTRSQPPSVHPAHGLVRLGSGQARVLQRRCSRRFVSRSVSR